VHDEPRPGGELAFERAVNLGDVDRRGSVEPSRREDLHRLAGDGRIDVALDYQHVAVRDLDTFEVDVDADGQAAFGAIGARRCGRRHR
jgi:hypothetical protein